MRQYLLLLFFSIGIHLGAKGQLAETPKNQWYGTASYYAARFEGRKTASGAVFRQDSLTAAHKSLPLGTRVKVTNRENQQCIEVIINDRMSKRSPHLIDLSKAGARELGFIRQGFALVSIEVISTLPKPDSQAEDIP
ncbi:MAG: septal ring lytic transglycosylase RlpA family lipoprotein [Sphingobacteriaceae bacterium]|nr:septal ring lytic transglycosylase RlpA family lipoprotein [Sphingobacteriaceae bacterium]